MLGYIVVVHLHYDSTEQVDESGCYGGPSKVYTDKVAAEKVAKQYDRSGESGYVWEVILP